jgi:hypothetical protein
LSVRAHLGLSALLVPVALLAVACGSSKPKEEPRLTEKQFVAAANRVCIASDRRIFHLGALSVDPAGWAKTAAAAQKGVDEMRAIRPPAERQAGFDRLLQLGTQVQKQIAAVRTALVAQNYTKARAAQKRATNLDTEVKLQSRRLGLTFCEQLLTNWPA